LKPSQIKQVIEAALKDPYRAPPIFMEGPPGVGKSAVAREVADEANVTLMKVNKTDKIQFGWLDTRASQHDPTDFRGIPAVVDGKAVWLPPDDIPFEFNKNLPERGIWFLDEITSAPPLVQAVLYQAVHEKRIGEHPLKKQWYILAAGNRIEDRAVTYRMSSALANRFTHLTFDVNLDDWIEWAKKAQINPNIMMFIRFKPEMLFGYNPESSEKAFMSPRTWDFASRHISITPTKLLPEVLTGTIGKGATAEFMAFLKLQTELPDINTIFAGDNFVPKRLDLTYALVGALATRAKGVKDYERMLQYSKNLETEFGVLLITMLAQKSEADMAMAPSFEKWAIANSSIIRKVN
jgi:AAA domain (dynein-related subfamily)